VVRAGWRRLGPLILLAVGLGLHATPAWARMKIDRYDSATLPKFRLWISLLDDLRPIPAGAVRGFTVYVNGEKLDDDVDFTTAGEFAAPMALGFVADARYAGAWESTLGALPVLLSKQLPEESRAFGIAAHHASITRIPDGEFAWSTKPEDLPSNFRDVESGGESQPNLYAALRRALKSYPLSPGLEPEADDGELPPPSPEGAPPFPLDRVLVVIGDGEIERVGGQATPSDRLRELVHMARRRGVRVMAVGILRDAEQSHLWTLRVLARKTGGTFRFAGDNDLIANELQDVTAELSGRFVLEARSDSLRPGDLVSFSVTAQTSLGANEETRDFQTYVDHKMGFFARVSDWISNQWERAPWWARLLVFFIVALIVTLIALVIIVRRVRRARAEAEAAEIARDAALAARRPCPICGNLMMPDWKTCLFCAQPVAPPARYRLTGRAGAWAGQSLKFDKHLVSLGSSERCDIVVPERRVAEEHAGLRDRGGEFVLTDFNTDLGTYVNGQRITQTALHEGDVIRIGDTEFVFGVESGG
jgi:hypothetical protein